MPKRLQPIWWIGLLVVLPIVSCSDDPASVDQTEFSWAVVPPHEEGLEVSYLNELTTEIKAGSFGKISSMLIVRNGKLVYEQYFRGMSRDQKHVAYSVTKSVTSALVGIAIEEGMIPSTEATISELLPRYVDLMDVGTKSKITLEHALQMRAGIEWKEFESLYGRPENIASEMAASADWIAFVLSQAQASEPGTSWNYNSGLSQVLGAVVEVATGEDARDYAAKKLLGPIGITDYDWDEGRGVKGNTGWGLSLKTRDMARFGLLYLNGGVWDEQQVISEEWIRRSFEPYSDLGDGFGYGYQWWMMPVGDKLASKQLPYADGWGDQLIIVISEFNMVVVSTAEHFEGQTSQMREILNDFVLPSAE